MITAFISDIFHFNGFHSTHINILLLIGMAIFVGTIGGRIFQKIKFPQVVGYIIIGIIIGRSLLNVFDEETVIMLHPFSYFALGFVGFMIGGELKSEVFKKYGKQFFTILFFEALSSFVIVTVIIGLLGTYLFHRPVIAWSLGLLLGAISSATAPAATTEVLREFKTKGPLTRTINGIVALDDALALILFSIAAAVAEHLSDTADSVIIIALLNPFYEIFGAIGIGVGIGLGLSFILKRYSEEDRLLTFVIGGVLLAIGISLALHMDILIASMALGITVVNMVPKKSKKVFSIVQRFTPPIYVLFFVLVGAELNVGQVDRYMLLFLGVYFFGRLLGKSIGAITGSKIAGAPITVQKYLWLCLGDQAGVAIGLSILAGQRFPNQIGLIVILVITASTFIIQLIAPALVKVAVTKAEEVGLNITEQDLIEHSVACDIIDREVPVLHEDVPFQKVLQHFTTTENLYLPVVDDENKLQGVVTIENLKKVLIEEHLTGILLAGDLMQPSPTCVKPTTSIREVQNILKHENLNFVPVVTDDEKFIGILEGRHIQQLISKKTLEFENKVTALG